LINGKFPDYERIIPRDIKHQVKLPKIDMIEAIKLITTISQDIKIIFNPKSIVFNSLSPDNVEAKTELQIPTNLNNFELNVNSRYLLDFISQIDSFEFEILLNEPTLPFVLKDKQFITVIMPIIV
jgi:DNA polymerase-3 subunit beta